MTVIKKTTDYNIFKKHEQNREIRSDHLKKIKASLQAANLLEFRPILVDRHMRVLDGQHRLEAAKELGIEVWYQMDPEAENENIILLNANSRAWSTEDYIHYYASQGKDEYRKLIEYAKSKNISIFDVIAFIKSTNSDIYHSIKAGSFKFDSHDLEDDLTSAIDKALVVIEELSKYSDQKTVSKSGRFKRALFQFLRNPDVDFDIFLKKLYYKGDAIRPYLSITRYREVLRDIYNWRNSSPLPITD